MKRRLIRCDAKRLHGKRAYSFEWTLDKEIIHFHTIRIVLQLLANYVVFINVKVNDSEYDYEEDEEKVVEEEEATPARSNRRRRGDYHSAFGGIAASGRLIF